MITYTLEMVIVLEPIEGKNRKEQKSIIDHNKRRIAQIMSEVMFFNTPNPFEYEDDED